VDGAVEQTCAGCNKTAFTLIDGLSSGYLAIVSRAHGLSPSDMGDIM